MGDKKFKTAFHDSINNYWKGIGATQAMIDNAVYCIIADSDAYRNSLDFSEFCAEMGYDEYDGESRRVYDACKKNYDGLTAILGEDQIDELYEIVEG